jgi:hypothetical protein
MISFLVKFICLDFLNAYYQARICMLNTCVLTKFDYVTAETKKTKQDSRTHILGHNIRKIDARQAQHAPEG